jgi:hypothetical protein
VVGAKTSRVKKHAFFSLSFYLSAFLFFVSQRNEKKKVKEMTFGYYFSPCGAKLATGWNGLEFNWLKGLFFFF